MSLKRSLLIHKISSHKLIKNYPEILEEFQKITEMQSINVKDSMEETVRGKRLVTQAVDFDLERHSSGNKEPGILLLVSRKKRWDLGCSRLDNTQLWSEHSSRNSGEPALRLPSL